MKILFFNLGTLTSRISNWGLEGYRSIFEQDVIFWGPIPDVSFIYDNREIPIIRIFEQTTVKDLFSLLPDGWFPDIVTCDTSVINFIPDIYKCPAKTLLFTRDAWADTIFNRGLVEFFDFLDHGIIDRKEYFTFNVNILPLSNCAVALPSGDVDFDNFKEREIDIISISNFTESFYHERHKIFYKLAEFKGESLNIKYITGINRNEISIYYQKSKIILDLSYTLSNRSFEAALNGCLLFSHERNPVIKEFWIPWEEYIPYNEENLVELIDYYIRNTSKAQKITKQAYNKIKTRPTTQGEAYWNQIRIASYIEIDVKERIKRCESVSGSILNHRTATALIYNYNYDTNFPLDWKKVYFERIDKAINEATEPEHRIQPLVEASRMTYFLNELILFENYLANLELILPDYPWMWYMRARQEYKKNNNDQAIALANRAIESNKNYPELLQKYILPVIEKNNMCDDRRIVDYLWQPVTGHNNELQVRSFFYLTYEILGDSYVDKGDNVNAVNAYSNAVSNIPLSGCLCKLNRLLKQTGDYYKIAELTEKGIIDSPYESKIVLYNAYALCKTNQKHKAVELLKKHKMALKCFYGKKRIAFVRQSISIILIISIFGKNLLSKAILYNIRFLLKKRNN